MLDLTASNLFGVRLGPLQNAVWSRGLLTWPSKNDQKRLCNLTENAEDCKRYIFFKFTVYYENKVIVCLQDYVHKNWFTNGLAQILVLRA